MNFLSIIDTNMRMKGVSIMSWYDRFSKLCTMLFDLLIQTKGTLRQRKAELSDQEVAELLTMSSDVWGILYDEQRHRNSAPSTDDAHPMWATFTQVGIHFESHQVQHVGQPITVWTWSIPQALVQKQVRGGQETKIQALREVLVWLVEHAADLRAEQRTALAADRATFEAWKAFKIKAGTWDRINPPRHPSESDDSALAE